MLKGNTAHRRHSRFSGCGDDGRVEVGDLKRKKGSALFDCCLSYTLDIKREGQTWSKHR